MKKVYCIGIGGIGVSALARYYISMGYQVFGSDVSYSKLIETLISEGCDIIIGSDEKRINNTFEKVIYTEAIPQTQSELSMAKNLGLKVLKYCEALGEIVNNYKLIAVAGTHGKSTTTSMISQIFLNSDKDFMSIVGTILKEFSQKNFYKRGDLIFHTSYSIIEACEYKKHFLIYKPFIGVITNIEYDHVDFFRSQQDYIFAFKEFIDNIVPGGFCIFSKDVQSFSLANIRKDITYIEMKEDYFLYDNKKYYFPDISMQISGDHILYDAKLAYIVGYIAGIGSKTITQTLSNYAGVWRRMEVVGITKYENILMSDYGHHPTEVHTTLQAIKKGYNNKKLIVVFQPHQYSRTFKFLQGFQECFSYADVVIVPNIYASRDSKDDIGKISAKDFTQSIKHPHIIFGDGFKNTIKILEAYEIKNFNSSIIVLQGAGDIDDLRFMIPLKNT